MNVGTKLAIAGGANFALQAGVAGASIYSMGAKGGAGGGSIWGQQGGGGGGQAGAGDLMNQNASLFNSGDRVS